MVSSSSSFLSRIIVKNDLGSHAQLRAAHHLGSTYHPGALPLKAPRGPQPSGQQPLKFTQ